MPPPYVRLDTPIPDSVYEIIQEAARLVLEDAVARVAEMEPGLRWARSPARC